MISRGLFNTTTTINRYGVDEMNKKIHIATSPLTGTIFAGGVLKDGRTWAANKKDLTIEALVAVAEHVTKFGEPVEIMLPNGELEYTITVVKHK
jgi:hypothetical protein